MAKPTKLDRVDATVRSVGLKGDVVVRGTTRKQVVTFSPRSRFNAGARVLKQKAQLVAKALGVQDVKVKNVAVAGGSIVVQM